MTKKVRIRIDRDLCVGAALCVAIVPRVFKIDEEGKAIVLTDEIDSSDRVARAAEECPASAIVYDDDVG